MGASPDFKLRIATEADIPAMMPIMDRAIRDLLKPYLPPDAVTASFEIMGIDRQLVADRTYFIAEDETGVVGCGGWSRRQTKFGGDHTEGRNAALLDPETEPARVRAMYTDPNHTRRGIGRAIIKACEDAAEQEGFKCLLLVSTLAGEPLYSACGYTIKEPTSATTSTGLEIPLYTMTKTI